MQENIENILIKQIFKKNRGFGRVFGGPGGGLGGPGGGFRTGRSSGKEMSPLQEGKKKKKRMTCFPSVFPMSCFLSASHSRADRENSQGKDLGGFQGYLKGIWGNPSLVKNERKTKEN